MTKTKNKTTEGPKMYSRDEHGLLSNIDYSFKRSASTSSS